MPFVFSFAIILGLIYIPIHGTISYKILFQGQCQEDKEVNKIFVEINIIPLNMKLGWNIDMQNTVYLKKICCPKQSFRHKVFEVAVGNLYVWCISFELFENSHYLRFEKTLHEKIQKHRQQSFVLKIVGKKI